MYKVLLVDDEPKSLEGLEIIIDWRSLGYTICGTCANGEEAIEGIRKYSPDVVITDIRMPGMNGLELIEYVKQQINYSMKFVIMSAYSEFEYAKRAMEQGVNYYILKPIMDEEVIEVLKEVKGQLDKQLELDHLQEEFDQETIKNVVLKLIQGIYVEEDLKEKIQRTFQQKEWYYIHIHIENQTEEKKRNKIINHIEQHIESEKDVFFITTKTCYHGILMGIDNKRKGQKEMTQFVKGLYSVVKKENSVRVYLAVSMKVSSILKIKEAYKTALEIMKFRVFRRESVILTYEEMKDKKISFEFEEIQYVEKLLDALANINQEETNKIITVLEKEFYDKCISPEILKMFIINIVYKSTQLIEEKDREYEKFLTQEDMKRVSKNDLTIGEMIKILKKYCTNMIQYIQELKNAQSKGVLYDIEQYIQGHFMESITIKEVASKFYMNPVYLGQVFTKTYGMSFNKYVHKLRIDKAQRLLKETDMKLNEIANKVGYTNYSRFIKKFEKIMKAKPSDFHSK